MTAESDIEKIVVVIVVSNMEYGGAQRQIVELANHIDEEQFELHVCSLSEYVPLADLMRRRDERLHVITKSHKYDVSVIPRLARLLRSLQADIVHGYLFDAEIATRLAGRLAGTRLIANCERNTNYTFKRIHRIAYRLTRPLVNLYVANSTAGATFNQKELGNKASIYYTVHNGVDTERFKPRDRRDAQSALGIDEGLFVVGMFGSFKEQKNHKLLFEAARRLIDQRPDTRLLLVGDELAGGMHGSTEYKQEMLELSRRLDLERFCIFVGNRRDVEKLYPACDVTALPSLFEGTPNVALESMACGVPVVATNVSDNAYVIRDGETGFVVPLGDVEAFASPLCEMAEDDSLCKNLGRNARRWMESEFSCERLARKTEDVYSGALGLATGGDASRLRSFQPD